MRYRLLLLLCVPLILPAEDHWVAQKSGPFEVLSDAGERPARDKLMFLEQFRETLRVITGKQDLRLVWPVRVLVFKKGEQMPAGASMAGFALGRDEHMAAATELAGFPPQDLKQLAHILLYDNTNRLPEPVEDGLAELLSTLQVNGTRITLGAPVPQPSRAWAMMHLLTVTPDYMGRTRVMISNLEQSADFAAACQNAFEKTAAQIEKQTDEYLKAGYFGTASMGGRALSPARDFKTINVDSDDAKVALADLQLASGAAQASAAYTALRSSKAAEGLGFIALKDHKNGEARHLFASAADAGDDDARAWLELGRLEDDPVKARAALKKASDLNSAWGAPYAAQADLEKSNLAQKAELLKKAASLDPRNIEYWQALARTETAAKNFAEAQKAWGGAERAAANEDERARIRQVRLEVEQERYDSEQAERDRVAAEKERDIQRVKAQSDAAIHAAELAARKKMNPNGEKPPEPAAWMNTEQTGPKVEGLFERLDCLGQQARMVIQTDDGKNVQLLVNDPSHIGLGGGGEKDFSCGPQKAPRRVVVQYTAKENPKLKTAGEVTVIEFH